MEALVQSSPQAVILFGVLGAIVLIGAGPTRTTVPSSSYTMHVVESGLHSEGVSGAGKSEWTARVVWAAGRGRMDLVGGSRTQLLAEGDYLLFDRTGSITVRPSAKVFFSPPMNVADSNLSAGGATGIVASIHDIEGSLDTLGPGEHIAGLPTARYRLKVRYAVAVDMGGIFGAVDPDDLGPDIIALMAPKKSTVEMTIDLWVAQLSM